MKRKLFILKVTSILLFCLLSNLSFSQVGAVSTFAGSSAGNLDGVGTASQLRNPAGMCVTQDGTTLYFCDAQNHSIRKVDLASSTVTTVAGTGSAGFNNGSTSTAQFNYPFDICVSNDGNLLYVSDKENNRIRKINLASNMVSTLAGTGAFGGVTDVKGHLATFNLPEGLELNVSGTYLYVADTDNHTIRRIDLVTDSMVTTAAGDGGATGGGYQDGTSATAKFKNPRGLCLSPDGTSLYIADNNNHCIRKLNLGTGTVTTYAGVGGSASSGSDDGALSSAKFSNPSGIVMSSDGKNIYVADYSNLKIRVVNTETNMVSSLAGGSYGNLDNTNGLLAKFAGPIAVAISTDDEQLFVADIPNHRIRVVRATLTQLKINLGGADNNLCAGESIILTSSIAGGNVWSTGETTDAITVSSANTITVTNNGVTSNPVIITVTTIDPSITGTSTLTASQTGATYMWVDCANPTVSLGSSQTFSAPANGDYQVILTVGSCSDTSACRTVTLITGLDDNSNLSSFLVYPNPNSEGYFYINTEKIKESDLNIFVHDLYGNLVYSELINDVKSKGIVKFTLPDGINKGVYLISSENDSLKFGNQKFFMQ